MTRTGYCKSSSFPSLLYAAQIVNNSLESGSHCKHKNIPSMKKGIFTTMILLATMFCAAQNGLTLNIDTTTAMSRIPLFSCGTSTVADADGNVYSTVQIGNQC
jgi:hypothetical protein